MYRGNNASDCMREAYKAGMIAAAEIAGNFNTFPCGLSTVGFEICESIKERANEIM